MHRIFIVEDHQIMRQVYEELISNETDLEICGAAETVEEALTKIPECQPELVIIDVSLKGKSGTDLVIALKEQWPEVLALMISGHDESIYAGEAIRSGARGYIMKDKFRLFISAIRQVLRGELFIGDDLRAKLATTDWFNKLDGASN